MALTLTLALGLRRSAQKKLATSTSLKGTCANASRSVTKPERSLPKPQRRQGCEGPGSARFTCLLDFRDGYYARSGLLDHLNSDGLDYRSDRLLHFPCGFLRWRGFGLGLGDCWLRPWHSLGCLTRLTALS